MKKFIIILIVLFALAPMVIIGVSLLRSEEVPEEPQSNNTGGQFPIGSETPAGSIFDTPDIPAILNRPQTKSVGDGAYVLESDKSGTRSHSITYAEFDNSYAIALYTFPLSSARIAAENELRSILQIDDASICRLSITVAVPMGVSETYAGQNLGLSFCPGSVQLP